MYIEWYYIALQGIDNIIGEKFAHINGIRYFVFPTQLDFGNPYKVVKKQLSD